MPYLISVGRSFLHDVHVADSEGEVTQDTAHYALAGHPRVLKSKGGVVKDAGTKGCDDDSLGHVVGVDRDLKESLQEAYLGEYSGTVKLPSKVSHVRSV